MAKAHQTTEQHRLLLWLRAGNGVCAKCGTTSHLTIDHIIPHSLLEQLFIEKEVWQNDKDNFQVLCRLCNGFKRNSLDHLNPMTKPLLEKYVKLFTNNCV